MRYQAGTALDRQIAYRRRADALLENAKEYKAGKRKIRTVFAAIYSLIILASVLIYV